MTNSIKGIFISYVSRTDNPLVPIRILVVTKDEQSYETNHRDIFSLFQRYGTKLSQTVLNRCADLYADSGDYDMPPIFYTSEACECPDEDYY